MSKITDDFQVPDYEFLAHISDTGTKKRIDLDITIHGGRILILAERSDNICIGLNKGKWKIVKNGAN